MHEAPLNFVAQAPLTRRKAMAWMAASIALANGACTEQPRELIHPWVNMPEASGAGLSAYYASAFLCEGHAMGVLIGTHDGRPIKIEGNPLHPSSLGGCDAAMQASVLDLWDPDRSKAVMQSLGGSGPGAVSSWSAFEAAWHARERVLHEHGGEGLALLTGQLS